MFYIKKTNLLIDGQGAYAYVANVLAVPALFNMIKGVGNVDEWARWAFQMAAATHEQLMAAAVGTVAAAGGVSRRRAPKRPASSSYQSTQKPVRQAPYLSRLTDEQRDTAVEDLIKYGLLSANASTTAKVAAAKRWVRWGRENRIEGATQLRQLMQDATAGDPEVQMALSVITGRSDNDRERANNILSREAAQFHERATGSGEQRRQAIKNFTITDGETELATVDMIDLYAGLTIDDLHQIFYGEIRCHDSIDCGEFCAQKELGDDGRSTTLSRKLREKTTLTAAECEHYDCMHLALAAEQVVFKSRRNAGDALFKCVTWFEPDRARFLPDQICQPRPRHADHNPNRCTQTGLQHGKFNRLYIGVERWLRINDDAVCCRLWSLRTHLANFALSLAPYFRESVVTLTVEASPWMDGTSMLKHAVGMGCWTLNLVDNSTAVTEQLITVPANRSHGATKKVSDILTDGGKELKTLLHRLQRPLPAFFAWTKETRSFGEMVARIMGVQLRYSTNGNYLSFPIGEKKCRILVKSGRLMGDYHAIQQFLGLYMSGKSVCPFLQVDASYGDYESWMVALEANGGSLTMDDYELISQRLHWDIILEQRKLEKERRKDENAERVKKGQRPLPDLDESTWEDPPTFSEQVRNAQVFGASPLLAGDRDINLAQCGLDVGAIVADPEHVMSALIRNVFFEFEGHLPETAKTDLGKLISEHVRATTEYAQHMDGRDWRKFLLRFDKILIPPVRDSKGPVAEATLLLKCLAIMYCCIVKEPKAIDKQTMLLFRAASFCWGSVLEDLQASGYFSQRVFNLYSIYIRVFLPVLFSPEYAPKLVSTQHCEAFWGPIRRFLAAGDHKMSRTNLRKLAAFLSGRDKYMEPFGTAQDAFKAEDASIVSEEEKKAEAAELDVYWRDFDFVIPAWVMRLSGVARKARLFEDVVLKDDYAGLHTHNEDGSWEFRTATTAPAALKPMDLPQAPSVSCQTQRTMRLVIQPPPQGADAKVKGCADKILVEEVSGSVEQPDGSQVQLRQTSRTVTKRLTKAECVAINSWFRRERGQELKGLKSKNLVGDNGLQEELWCHHREYGTLTPTQYHEALDDLVPAGYDLAAADDGDRRTAQEQAESEAEREAEELELSASIEAEEREAAAAQMQAGATGDDMDTDDGGGDSFDPRTEAEAEGEAEGVAAEAEGDL